MIGEKLGRERKIERENSRGKPARKRKKARTEEENCRGKNSRGGRKKVRGRCR